jgi:hypothetical protein
MIRNKAISTTYDLVWNLPHTSTWVRGIKELDSSKYRLTYFFLVKIGKEKARDTDLLSFVFLLEDRDQFKRIG